MNFDRFLERAAVIAAVDAVGLTESALEAAVKALAASAIASVAAGIAVAVASAALRPEAVVEAVEVIEIVVVVEVIEIVKIVNIVEGVEPAAIVEIVIPHNLTPHIVIEKRISPCIVFRDTAVCADVPRVMLRWAEWKQP